jgi:hypothetical protein
VAGDADTDGDGDLDIAVEHRRSQGREQIMHCLWLLLGTLQAMEHGDKLITADSGDDIAAGPDRLHVSARSLQQAVTASMAKAVVDLLEAIKTEMAGGHQSTSQTQIRQALIELSCQQRTAGVSRLTIRQSGAQWPWVGLAWPPWVDHGLQTLQRAQISGGGVLFGNGQHTIIGYCL